MYIYDDHKKILRIQQRELPRVRSSVLSMRESFNHYRDVVIYKDLEDFASYLTAKRKRPIEFKNIRMKEVHHEYYGDTVKRDYFEYYADLHITISGIEQIVTNCKIFTLPDLDSDNSFNGRQIVYNFQREDYITYNRSKNEISFPMSGALFIIKSTANSLTANFGSMKLNVYDLLYVLLEEANIPKPAEVINDNFSSMQMQDICYSMKGKFSLTHRSAVEEVIGARTLASFMKNDRFRINAATNKLCRELDGHWACGKHLSRDIGNYKQGAVVTQLMLDELALQGIHCVHIFNTIALNKGLSNSVLIENIPRGTKIPEDLQIAFNLYEDFASQDYTGLKLEIPSKTWASQEIMQFMFDCGAHLNPDNRLKMCYFEHEVQTSSYIRLAYFSRYINFKDSGLTESDYICLKSFGYNILKLQSILTQPNAKEILQPEHLNYQDIFALVSYTLAHKNVGTDVLLLDEDFRKECRGICETLSAGFHAVMGRYFTKHYDAIANKWTEKLTAQTVEKDLYYLWDEIVSYLVAESYMRPIDYTNPASLVASNRTCCTIIKEGNEAQHSVLMLHFGRVDPYETPTGSKLGIANSLTACSKVVNGQIKTPYHPIIDVGGGKRKVSSEVVWLSSLEDINFRLGEINSIHTESGDLYNSPIIPEKINVRMRMLGTQGEKVDMERALSTTCDYVTADYMATLSYTSQLIPFFSANDGVRNSYACSMFKQALYLKDGEAPIVATDAYAEIVQGDSSYCIIAPSDGVCTDVSSSVLCYNSLDGSSSYAINMEPIMLRNQSVTVLDATVKVGETFRKGDIIADTPISRKGMFSPGIHMLVAYMPYYGFNHEDAIPISQSAATRLDSIGINRINKDYVKRIGIDYKQVSATNPYIRPNDEICKFIPDQSTGTDEIIVRAPRDKFGLKLAYKARIGEEKCELNTTLGDFCSLDVGDKIVGRHGNKSTTSTIIPDDQMPMFANGVVVEAIQNPTGVVSRMNIGQQLEAHLGFVMYLLGITAISNPFNGASRKDIKELLTFVYDCANCDTMDEVRAKWSGTLPSTLIDQAESRFDVLQNWKGCFDETGKAILYNPKTGKNFAYPITFGVGYYMKLHHQSDHKMHGRAGLEVGSYNAVDKQPPQGSARTGGQRLGDMEFGVLGAHGTSAFIKECLNEKSDNVLMRSRLVKCVQGEEDYANFDSNPYGTSPRGFELATYNLECLGVQLRNSQGYDLSTSSIAKRFYNTKAAKGLSFREVQQAKTKEELTNLNEEEIEFLKELEGLL